MAGSPRHKIVYPQHKNAYQKMCASLREMRERAKLSQRDLGQALRMHGSMVHRTETGSRRIDPLEFVAWCRACGVDPGQAIRQL